MADIKVVLPEAVGTEYLLRLTEDEFEIVRALFMATDFSVTDTKDGWRPFAGLGSGRYGIDRYSQVSGLITLERLS